MWIPVETENPIFHDQAAGFTYSSHFISAIYQITDLCVYIYTIYHTYIYIYIYIYMHQGKISIHYIGPIGCHVIWYHVIMSVYCDCFDNSCSLYNSIVLSTNLLLKFQCFQIASRIETWEWHGNLSNPNIPLFPISDIVNVHAHVFIKKNFEKGPCFRDVEHHLKNLPFGDYIPNSSGVLTCSTKSLTSHHLCLLKSLALLLRLYIYIYIYMGHQFAPCQSCCHPFSCKEHCLLQRIHVETVSDTHKNRHWHRRRRFSLRSHKSEANPLPGWHTSKSSGGWSGGGGDSWEWIWRHYTNLILHSRASTIHGPSICSMPELLPSFSCKEHCLLQRIHVETVSDTHKNRHWHRRRRFFEKPQVWSQSTPLSNATCALFFIHKLCSQGSTQLRRVMAELEESAIYC